MPSPTLPARPTGRDDDSGAGPIVRMQTYGADWSWWALVLWWCAAAALMTGVGGWAVRLTEDFRPGLLMVIACQAAYVFVFWRSLGSVGIAVAVMASGLCLGLVGTDGPARPAGK
ncbi:hypothetical protein [Micromonospora sp. WMMD737]|uniref:hypothetical protein n=1 Tax=Micromonospora sp. WMMD737 TaxID=3404113 RepID=UPI003B94290D